MALIQVALDTLDYEQTIRLAQRISPYVDIIELGTPCVKYNGIRIVETVHTLIPKCLTLADLKTMDAGLYEASPFYEAGADIVTVLGAADAGTIKGVVEASKSKNAQAQVDLINVKNKLETVAIAYELGAHIIGVHTGLDQQAKGQTPFEDLKKVQQMKVGLKISVAGGINKDTVRQAIDAGADIVVVGAAIYGAADPVRAAAEIREAVERG
jgi:3-hexulose-6-phosphate synthase